VLYKPELKMFHPKALTAGRPSNAVHALLTSAASNFVKAPALVSVTFTCQLGRENRFIHGSLARQMVGGSVGLA